MDVKNCEKDYLTALFTVLLNLMRYPVLMLKIIQYDTCKLVYQILFLRMNYPPKA